MNKNYPTIQDCKDLVKKYPKVFFVKEHNVDNYTIKTFSYYKHNVSYEFFKNNQAFHMRGISFCGDKVFPMLDKFFNVAEHEDLSIENLSKKRIESVQIKDDGSLIGFIVLPNNKVVSKTKSGFDNDYTKIADKWLQKNNNQEKIIDLYKKGIFPLFECISKDHKIVLDYDFTDLRFIQARTIQNSFLKVSELKKLASEYEFNFLDEINNLSFNKLLDIRETERNIEGYIIRFCDNTFVKIKTSWYFEQHRNSEITDRANYILDLFFKNKKNLDLEDYEKKFLKEVVENVFIPEKIETRKDFLSFLKSSQNLEEYKKIYATFKKNYNLNNSYDKVSSLMQLVLNNKLDDHIEKMSSKQLDKAIFIQKAMSFYLEKHINKIRKSLNFSSPKEIALNNKGYPYIGIMMRLFSDNNLDISDALIKSILNKVRNEKKAIEFLDSLERE
jgi:hypothetical protein